MDDSTTTQEASKTLGKVIKIDEAKIQDHLGEMVRQSVEQTLNGLLDAEADRLCNAGRYQRSPDPQDTRAGHYTRKLHTKAAEACGSSWSVPTETRSSTTRQDSS